MLIPTIPTAPLLLTILFVFVGALAIVTVVFWLVQDIRSKITTENTWKYRTAYLTALGLCVTLFALHYNASIPQGEQRHELGTQFQEEYGDIVYPRTAADGQYLAYSTQKIGKILDASAEHSPQDVLLRDPDGTVYLDARIIYHATDDPEASHRITVEVNPDETVVDPAFQDSPYTPYPPHDSST